ncbi:MAG: hypothetical protein LBR64_03005 [Dysgonamonadaceae bacterium]|jgi:hypothetical protein|nr:hypothetical protein [Dysgonamonadaceae bacterium]
MAEKKLPETDEERLEIMENIIAQEEICLDDDKLLNDHELQMLKNFLDSFTAARQFLLQAKDDEKKAYEAYKTAFNNAKMYISHFLQVLLMSVQRKEIKPESLLSYGFTDAKEPKMPEILTRESVARWGESVINGETERISRGGFPIYNPAIAKVKVHYELFNESGFSLDIYRKNVARLQANLVESQEKADSRILEVWDRLEEKFADALPLIQAEKYKDYKIKFLYGKGEQLNVFG